MALRTKLDCRIKQNTATKQNKNNTTNPISRRFLFLFKLCLLYAQLRPTMRAFSEQELHPLWHSHLISEERQTKPVIWMRKVATWYLFYNPLVVFKGETKALQYLFLSQISLNKFSMAYNKSKTYLSLQEGEQSQPNIKSSEANSFDNWFLLLLQNSLDPQIRHNSCVSWIFIS